MRTFVEMLVGQILDGWRWNYVTPSRQSAEVVLDALNREGFDAEIVEHADGDYEVKPTDSQAREMGKIPQGQRWTP